MALVLIALVATGCTDNTESAMSATRDPSGAAAITLTCNDFPPSDTNSTVSPVATLATGAILTITLCDVGSDGGYQWSEPVHDPNALALVGEGSFAPPNQPWLVGASGSSTWRFQALTPKSSTVTFADRRVWEEGIPPFLSVVVSVKATPSSSFTPLPVVTAAATAAAPSPGEAPSTTVNPTASPTFRWPK